MGRPARPPAVAGEVARRSVTTVRIRSLCSSAVLRKDRGLLGRNRITAAYGGHKETLFETNRQPAEINRQPADDGNGHTMQRDQDEAPQEKTSATDRSGTQDASGDGLSPAEAARNAVKQLQELTGLAVEMVSGLERTDNGWKLAVEMLELERVPQSMSLLATYEMEVDRQGDLIRYQRSRRYARGQADC